MSVAIDERTLMKSQVRKLNALRKSASTTGHPGSETTGRRCDARVEWACRNW